MTTSAVRFAVLYAALTGSHELADYWVQSDTDAQAKGKPGAAGRLACARHVATYTATQAATVAAVDRAFGLGLTWRRAALGLAVSAATHYAADRSAGHWRDAVPSTLLPRLAVRLGKNGWISNDPGAGPLLDQSWHKAWITLAAALAAAGPRV